MIVGYDRATISAAVWLVLINSFLFGLDRFGWLRLARAPLERVAVPIQTKLSRIGTAVGQEFSRPFQARVRLQTQEDLQERLNAIRAENNYLRLRISELEDQLKLEEVLPRATIIQAGLVEAGERLVVNKGSADGVRSGAAAVVGNVLIGKVTSLTPHTALVTLVTDPEIKLPVLVVSPEGKFGSEQVRGLAVGRFHQEIELTQVLASENISKGQLVVTAGDTGVPRYLVIGEIVEVKKAQAEVFTSARVKTMVDFKRLRSVSLILTAAE